MDQSRNRGGTPPVGEEAAADAKQSLREIEDLESMCALAQLAVARVRYECTSALDSLRQLRKGLKALRARARMQESRSSGAADTP